MVNTPIKVFLLDDHEIVRRGLRDLLESEGDITVVGEASTQDEAVRRVPALDPDVAVLDVRLAEGNGVEACREIRSTSPADGVPDPDVVLRRRGAVRGDHGRGGRVRAQADPLERPRRRRPPRRPPGRTFSIRR